MGQTNGFCLYRGYIQEFAGPDCGFEVAELQTKPTLERLGVPFTSRGKFDPDVDLMVTARSLKRYSKQLCRSPACVASWEAASSQLGPFLPKEEPRLQFKSCAVVSSAQQMVPAAPKQTAQQQPHTAHGTAIDEHSMVRVCSPTSRWEGKLPEEREAPGRCGRAKQSPTG